MSDDGEEDTLASLGVIYFNSELNIKDLKKSLTQYASDRYFLVTLTLTLPSIPPSLFKP
jgi:hypothetical protein